jgi:hypothetical protein
MKVMTRSIVGSPPTKYFAPGSRPGWRVQEKKSLLDEPLSWPHAAWKPRCFSCLGIASLRHNKPNTSAILF